MGSSCYDKVTFSITFLLITFFKRYLKREALKKKFDICQRVVSSPTKKKSAKLRDFRPFETIFFQANIGGVLGEKF